MTPSWPGDLATRLSRRALSVAALLVPWSTRDAWLSEWEGELWQLRSRERRSFDLVLFLSGALWDGLGERKEGWRGDSLVQDLRFAGRTLARSPGFAAAAAFTLALSIGASTALFSVVEAALLAKPPYPDPERIVVIDMLFGPDTIAEPSRWTSSQWSYPRYEALREEIRSVESLAGYGSLTMTLSELGDAAVISVEIATPSLFPLLGIIAERGRTLGPEHEENGAADMVAVVSNSFWRTRMGNTPDVVGSEITLDGHPFQVLGVLADGFEGVTGGAEVWIPFSALREVAEPSMVEDPWNQYFFVMGRLASGASLEQARSEVQAFGATVMERFPAPRAASQLRSGGDVLSFMEARKHPATTVSMLVLFGAVILVLLIATANLAGLLLARGASRQREAAIRASLGAGRVRLLRQMLTESLTLSAIGGILGVGLAAIGVDVLGTWLTDALGTSGGRGLEYVNGNALSINWRVTVFAVMITAGVGLAIGLIPAWDAARTDPNKLLRGGGDAVNPRRLRLGITGRNGLIAGQVALAIVLLAGASLMLRTMVNLQRFDLGFEPARLMTAMYSLSPADEQAGVDLATFHTRVLERVRALPGVVGATLGEVPMGGPTWRTIVMGSDGRPDLIPEQHTWIRMQAVADGHMSVLGVTLLEGRDIERTDDAGADKVIVLSRSTADELFPDGGAIGRRIRIGGAGYMDVGATVVGIVEDIVLGRPGTAPERQGYVSVRQAPRLETGLLVRTAGDPEALVPAVRSALAELAPNTALTSIMSMESRAWMMAVRPRVLTALLGFFGFVALLLVAVGLYGTIAYTVARRTRELGLRASLGADSRSLVTLVLRQGLGVTLAGILAGIAASFWATRFLSSLLVGTEAFDPVGLALVSAALFLVALVAAYVPARRSMRADPMVSLKTE